jgi:membrane dipeptidase
MADTAVAEDKALALHQRAVIVNMLGGVKRFPTLASPRFILPEVMAAGGTTVVSWTMSGSTSDFAQTATRVIGALEAIEQSEIPARLVRTTSDILATKAQGVLGFVLNFQNTSPIEDNLAYVSLFHRLGVRVIQLTYQRRNLVGDGCGEPGEGAGLSLFGRDLVRELNRRRILIDLSHRTTIEAIELSDHPVAFTHVNVREINPEKRNKPAEQMRLVAEKGGVIGINSVARMLSPTGRERGTTIDDYVDQIEHVAELVGADHVGIGLDRVEDLTSEDMEERRRTFLTQFPELRAGGDFPFEHYYTRDLSMGNMLPVTRELLARGFSEDEVLGILGGNFLRLLGCVWGDSNGGVRTV